MLELLILSPWILIFLVVADLLSKEVVHSHLCLTQEGEEQLARALYIFLWIPIYLLFSWVLPIITQR